MNSYQLFSKCYIYESASFVLNYISDIGAGSVIGLGIGEVLLAGAGILAVDDMVPSNDAR